MAAWPFATPALYGLGLAPGLAAAEGELVGAGAIGAGAIGAEDAAEDALAGVERLGACADATAAAARVTRPPIQIKPVRITVSFFGQGRRRSPGEGRNPRGRLGLKLSRRPSVSRVVSPGVSQPTGNEPDARVRPFSWHLLERFPREVVTSLRDVRRSVRAMLDESKLAKALGEMIGERVSVRVLRVTVVSSAPESLALTSNVRFALGSVDDAVRVELDLEHDLARALVARVLARPYGFADPLAAASPELLGACAAVIAAVARRAHGDTHALMPLGPSGLSWPDGERRLRIDAAVTLGADSFQARAMVQVRTPSEPARCAPDHELRQLGALPLTLGMIVAVSTAGAREVFGLAAGDIWLPGAGWTVQRIAGSDHPRTALTGRVRLGGATAERAIAATLGSNGDLVVVGVEPMQIDQPAEETSVSEPADTATSDVVLDAPLVVRVEVGAVTMTAREWAQLTPGDVIAMGRRLAEPVLLRVAGVEVARGDLVDVEGELGVRIRERTGAA
jgi:flagellar motor switch/type III secretory pathway protein FliN